MGARAALLLSIFSDIHCDIAGSQLARTLSIDHSQSIQLAVCLPLPMGKAYYDQGIVALDRL
jgi:hypothetical protein